MKIFFHFLIELPGRLRFFVSADRIGPDVPLTHWMLHFKSLMRWLCEKRLMAFGENSEIRPGAYIVNCSTISIGRDVIVRPGSMFFGEYGVKGPSIAIEDKVLLGSGVHIYGSNHNFSDVSRSIFDQGSTEPEPVRIMTGAWLGANVVILPGVTVGRNSVVGAQSVVTKSVPDFTVVAGNPARVLKTLSAGADLNV